MKDILFALNPLFPERDHDSNLVLRLVPHMDSKSKIVTLDTSECESNPPNNVDGIPTYFEKMLYLV